MSGKLTKEEFEALQDVSDQRRVPDSLWRLMLGLMMRSYVRAIPGAAGPGGLEITPAGRSALIEEKKDG